ASSNEHDAAPKSQSKKRARVNPRAEPKLTELEQRLIWLDLAQSHVYALKHFKYESNADERIRVMKRGAWRLIEQGAKLSRRTDMAVVIALAPLDNGKASVDDVVYVSPNLCDAARPALRGMAQTFRNEFTKTMHGYREAGRADAARQMEANKRLMAEKAELLAQNAELQAQIQRLSASTSGSNTQSRSDIPSSSSASRSSSVA
ncbi:hypothetical protein CF336_g8964, partial [Tilletia laevis]